jgi:hypothetical protein
VEQLQRLNELTPPPASATKKQSWPPSTLTIAADLIQRRTIDRGSAKGITAELVQQIADDLRTRYGLDDEDVRARFAPGGLPSEA